MHLSNKVKTALIYLFLSVTTIAVYGQVCHFAFVTYDDTDYVSRNLNVQQGFTPESIRWAFTTVHASNWHPLTWLSHMLDCRLFGLNPGMQHLTSLFFHILNTLLLFAVFRKMTGKLWQSAFVAALFALHPLHVESVAWLSERKDVLSMFFGLLTMWAYVVYVSQPSVIKYFRVFLFFMLGLMAKPMVVTLPCVLLLMDFWPLKRLSFSATPDRNLQIGPLVVKLVFEKLPLFLLVIISCGVTYYAQQHGGAVIGIGHIPISNRISNAVVSYVVYITKMIVPIRLACLYPHPDALPRWQVLFAAIFLAAVTAMVLRETKRHPYLPVGWFWYLGTLVPVIGLVQVGSQAMADRYTYIPLIGLFVMVAWGVPEIVRSWKFRNIFLSSLSGGIILILALMTWQQVGYWKNSTTLFEHALAVTHNNYAMHYNLGIVLEKKGRDREAMAQFLKAIEIKPEMIDAHNNLAILYVKLGKTDLAIDHFLKILAIDPGFAGASLNLAIALDSQGKEKEAIPYFLTALKAMPDNSGVLFKAANAQFKTGDIDGAITHYQQALKIQPDFTNARCNLGVALFRKGDLQGAISEFKAVLKSHPDYRPAKQYLKKALSRIAHEKK